VDVLKGVMIFEAQNHGGSLASRVF
jgi:hypothetical protein